MLVSLLTLTVPKSHDLAVYVAAAHLQRLTKKATGALVSQRKARMQAVAAIAAEVVVVIHDNDGMQAAIAGHTTAQTTIGLLEVLEAVDGRKIFPWPILHLRATTIIAAQMPWTQDPSLHG